MRPRYPLVVALFLALVASCASDSPAGEAGDVLTTDSTPSDATVPETMDAGLPDAADASPSPEVDDTAVIPDEGLTPPEPSDDLPTWWDCRRALTSNQITLDLQIQCDSLYTAPPSDRAYGIRWVFLMDVGDQEAWIADKLAMLNTLFAPADFTFHTQSTITLDNPVVTQATSEVQAYVFEDIQSDVAVHLGSTETDTDVLFALFKEQMADVGVHPDALQSVTLETSWEVQEFHQAMARLRPEQIHVWVVEKINDTNTSGGMSGPPGPNPTSPRVSIVNIKGGEVGLPAFPHEMGHYFGLQHPHGKRENNEVQLPFDFDQHLKKSPVKSSLVDALKDTLGAQLDAPVGEQYVPYNVKGQDSQALTRARYAIAQLAITHAYMYRDAGSGPESFASLKDFVDAGVAKEPMYYKNTIQQPGPDQAPNNCYWDDNNDMVACDVGDPVQTYLGTDPFLDGSIALANGQEVNLMSYIAKQLPSTLDTPMVALTPEQIAVMRVHANTPVRQCLRNHTLQSGLE